MAPETAKGSSSEVKAKPVGQTTMLQRWIRKNQEPDQAPSHLHKEHLQRVHDTSTGGAGYSSYYILEALDRNNDKR